MDLKGKTAVVTGGGSGIGLGIALELAGAGCRVAIAGRTESKLAAAAGRFEGRPPIRYRACDVADRAETAALFEWVARELGPVDILVNSAGVNIPNRRFSAMEPEDWDRVMAINATGAYQAMYAVIPAMRRRGGGLIVNISSIAGKRAMKLGGVAYCASKFAMTALGTTVGLEESEHGIHVTNIYPGEVNTPILADRPTPVPPERLAAMLVPEDVAAMVVAIARLHPRAVVPELVITPLYQEYA